MRVILDQGPGGARVLALGTFDGVHLGHQALLKAGKEYARTHGIQLRVCSFDRHPLEILRPEAAPRLLSPGEEQAERMAACGAEELTVMPFTAETAGTEPEDFLAGLRAAGDLKAVVAGWNCSFGRGGRGDVLKELSEACAEEGIKFGIYISPWDRFDPHYGTPEYNQVFEQTLRSALSGYGPVFEQWFDGACGRPTRCWADPIPSAVLW